MAIAFSVANQAQNHSLDCIFENRKLTKNGKPEIFENRKLTKKGDFNLKKLATRF